MLLNRYLQSLALVYLGFCSSAEAVDRLSDSSMGVEAGIAAVDVTPVKGVPLAGFGGGNRRLVPFDWLGKYKYATFLKPSQGRLDAIRSKALYIKNGDQKLLFISLDVVGATANFVSDLVKRLKKVGFKENEIFVSATHTHSGPGTLSKERVWELLAADKFQSKIYERFVQGVLESVRIAMTNAESSHLYRFDFEAKGLQRNRREANRAFDPASNGLFVWADRGQWLGGIVNVAVHGTSLNTDNLLFSADMPGALEASVQQRLGKLNSGYLNSAVTDPVVLFINGAEGDVAPRRGGVQGMAELSDSFGDQLMEALHSASLVEPKWTVRETKSQLGPARFNIQACVSKKLRKWINRHLFIGLQHSLPSQAPLWVIDFGKLKLLTWPGEPTTSVGFKLKDMARQAGAEKAWVLGLTNGYMAYFTSPEEFKEGGYEACSSLYGANGASRILDTYQTLLGLPNSSEN